MNTKRYSTVVGTVAGLVTISFFLGKTLEERALLHRQADSSTLASPVAETTKATQPRYQELALSEILQLPFSDFYEALRAAPREARRKWAADLEAMPANARRAAAYSAYYKLLAQFDPREAIADIKQIKDRKRQRFAFETVADSAPPFAMPELAEFAAALAGEGDRYPDGFYEVMRQWSIIDPLAAARFVEQHPGEKNNGCYSDIISNLAALDPEVALSWIQRPDLAAGDTSKPSLKDAFIGGLYYHDRVAATSFALAHADDPVWREACINLFGTLSYESKEEAKLFFEKLPDEAAKHSAIQALEWMAESGSGEEVGPERTPRAVAEWETQFAPEYWKGELSKVFKRWSDYSPQELVDWIVQLGPEVRDAVANEFIKDDDKSLEETLGPVFALSDEQLRQRLLVAMGEHWNVSKGEAREKINMSALTLAQKAQLLRLVDASVDGSGN